MMMMPPMYRVAAASPANRIDNASAALPLRFRNECRCINASKMNRQNNGSVMR